MGFQWDPAKDAANRAKHRVSFRQAAEIFRGMVLVVPDTRRDYGERRYVALGVNDGEVLRVAFTDRDGDIRIISAWKASKHDRETYRRAQEDSSV